MKLGKKKVGLRVPPFFLEMGPLKKNLKPGFLLFLKAAQRGFLAPLHFQSFKFLKKWPQSLNFKAYTTPLGFNKISPAMSPPPLTVPPPPQPFFFLENNMGIGGGGVF